MSNLMLHGSLTALASPFSNGALDEASFRAFVQWQLSEGTHGLVPCGTTGEAPALTGPERVRLIEICLEEAQGKAPVIAGAGSNVTKHACTMAEEAKALGADAILVAAPYYNKPSQEGLYAHYAAIAQIGIPIVVYNVPGRTIVDISVETMARLANLEMVIGVKDATGDIGRVADQKAACDPDFVLLSGDDFSALGFAAHGGTGCISVTANVAPRLCAQMQEAMRSGDYAKARVINDALQPLHRALFRDASPAPTKYALATMGKMSTELRLPLVEANAAAQKAVDDALTALGTERV